MSARVPEQNMADHLDTVSASAAFRLGEILVVSGQITHEQLHDTLEKQKISDKKIGELLVESGYLQSNQVEHGIRLQHILVSAALGTVMAFYLPVCAEAGGATGNLQATASVKSIARITVLHQQPQMVITSENIAQGYLDVPVASRLEVRSSSLSGYLITFEVREGPFLHVLVRGLETEMQVSFGSGWMVMPHCRTPKILELTYRFVLTADAKSGTYPWPIQISTLAI